MFLVPFLLGCAFADHVYHRFRKFKNCVLMFSRLSREFGGGLFLCAGLVFVLWDFVHSVGPFVR